MTKVAVYGSLRKGMGNNGILKDQEFLGCTVTDTPYAMYSLGGFPRIALHGDAVSPITVEIYEVDEATMQRLDRLEGYRGEGHDNFYDRSAIKTVDGHEALIYHIEESTAYSRGPLVEHGDWVRYVQENRVGRTYKYQ